jgi:hypothetical protein
LPPSIVRAGYGGADIPSTVEICGGMASLEVPPVRFCRVSALAAAQ